MENDDFDLDQTTDGDESLTAAVDAIDATTLAAAISGLPSDLRGIATGVLIERRTLSDISQELGMRQAEVVRGLRRARRSILARLNIR